MGEWERGGIYTGAHRLGAQVTPLPQPQPSKLTRTPLAVFSYVPRFHPHVWPAQCLQGFRFGGESQKWAV